MLSLDLLRRKKTTKPVSDVGAWVRRLQEQMKEMADNELVADCSAIEQINSDELGELARIHLKLRQENRRLVLENANQLMLDVLELTRMNRLIEIRTPRTRAMAK